MTGSIWFDRISSPHWRERIIAEQKYIENKGKDEVYGHIEDPNAVDFSTIQVICFVIDKSIAEDRRRKEFGRAMSLHLPVIENSWRGSWTQDLIMVGIEFLGESFTAKFFEDWPESDLFLTEMRPHLATIRAEKLLRELLR